MLHYLATGLAELPAISCRDEPAVRTIIMLLYDVGGSVMFETELAQVLQAAPVGSILSSMREHFSERQKAIIARKKME